MMKSTNYKRLYWLFAVMMFACKEKYTLPPGVSENSNFLVVEGYIKVGQDTTLIHLTRTRGLTNSGAPTSEYGANVEVQDDAGGNYPLQELGNGDYFTPSIAGSNNQKYKLVISTQDGNKYESDFVESKMSPAIDSISWEEKQDGVHIYANTHDDAAKTKYYKWDYTETYEYHAPFNSQYIVPPGSLVPVGRTPEQNINVCFKTEQSTNIFIASTARLTSDVVYKKELLFIPVSTQKLGVLYSILVKQYALTEQGFDFWQTLGKNTENLGSLFDVQPSVLTGNIHCTSNPGQPVVGFVSASTVQEKRIFIYKQQLAFWNYPLSPYGLCDTVHISSLDLAQQYYIDFRYIPVSHYDAFNFYATSSYCADCLTGGGVRQKPSFWP